MIEISCPYKHFLGTLLLITRNSFLQSDFWKGTCRYELLKYNLCDRYFNLKRIFILKEHLQPYIWVVPSLFQESFCSDLWVFVVTFAISLVFSRVLFSLKQALVVIPFSKGIELIRNSNCSYPFDEQQNKRGNAAKHFFKFTVFAKQEL